MCHKLLALPRLIFAFKQAVVVTGRLHYPHWSRPLVDELRGLRTPRWSIHPHTVSGFEGAFPLHFSVVGPGLTLLLTLPRLISAFLTAS
ncbi:hypothetical protein PF007_g8799 [Phytophthora fragariae]|uniref:Secreted protein n=1 Tax=Phytophthora fragariae TaxID=53985 RepID=A0A6A3SK90_9STRA|nr:hypothetical protein PF007_g8799 [Phytophthora fragariae]